jgi:hypothetical protein
MLAVEGVIEAACDSGASFMSAVIKSMLLDGLDEAFDKKSWHGPNLRGAIRGVTAVQAAWRPAGDRHNIWELTLHAAYWKYVVRRKILREKRGSFVLAGSNFFERPEGGSAVAGSAAAGSAATVAAPSEAAHGETAPTETAPTETAWKRDIAILEVEHQNLRDIVAGLPGRAFTPAVCHLIRGAAAHDLYHAGQIRLLRRMCT